MNDKDLAPKDTLIIEVPGSAPLSNVSGGVESASPNVDDTDDPDTHVNPASGQHDHDPVTMARPQGIRVASGPQVVEEEHVPASLDSGSAMPPVPEEPVSGPVSEQAPGPWPMVSEAPYTISGPQSGGPFPRGPSPPSRSPLPFAALATGALAGLVAVLVVGGIAIAYFSFRGRDNAVVSTSQSGTPIEVARVGVATGSSVARSEIDPPNPSNSTDTAASSETENGSDSPDDQARNALARLRDGIGECVKNTIRILPGTSVPIPDSLAWLKHGPYVSGLHDWVGPFFSCTKFKMEKPMPFMIQWQLEKPGDHGNAIAWVDGDSDGKAEHAFGFTARLKEHGVVEFGPIGPVDASRKIAKH